MAGTVNIPVSTNGRRGRRQPSVEQVSPGLWSIPVSWPGSPLRYTLAYLLSGRDGAVLIDTGWPTDEGWENLANGIRLAGHEITDITDVLVTHAHPDHIGMAARVRELSAARVSMHPAEADLVERLRTASTLNATARWLRARGAPAGEAAEIVARITEAVARYTQLAQPDVLVSDGSLPVPGVALRAIWTPGHSPGHLCFYDEDRNLMLTGDHVLPRISPHIGLDGDDEDDSLRQYLGSLRTLTRYAPSEVLPAHEYRFTGLDERVAELLAHHQVRLAEIEHAVTAEPGASTWRVAELLSWSRGWAQTTGMTRRAAVSETLAHLAFLQGQDRVVNSGRPKSSAQGTGAHGVDGVDGVDAWLPGPRAAAVPGLANAADTDR